MVTNIHASELSMDNFKIPSKQKRLLREIYEKLKGTFLVRHKMHQQSILAYTYGSRADYSQAKELRSI
jgi:hypothetical protein